MLVGFPLTQRSGVMFEGTGSGFAADVRYRVLVVPGVFGCWTLCSLDAPSYAAQVQAGGI